MLLGILVEFPVDKTLHYQTGACWLFFYSFLRFLLLPPSFSLCCLSRCCQFCFAQSLRFCLTFICTIRVLGRCHTVFASFFLFVFFFCFAIPKKDSVWDAAVVFAFCFASQNSFERFCFHTWILFEHNKVSFENIFSWTSQFASGGK